MPIHDRHQINEAMPQADIRDVRAPDLIDALNFHPAQQVRINPVAGRALRQARLLIEGLPIQHAQEPPHPFVIDVLALLVEPDRQTPNPVKRRAQVLLIQQPQQAQVRRALGARRIVVTGARQTQQLALPPHAQLRVCRLDQVAFDFNCRPQLFF